MEENRGAFAVKASAVFIITTGKIEKMPRIVPCGSRNNAFEKYLEAVLNEEEAMLLVDSERPVNEHSQSGAPGIWLPWVHLQHDSGDGWVMPEGDAEENCHLMVECMCTVPIFLGLQKWQEGDGFLSSEAGTFQLFVTDSYQESN